MSLDTVVAILRDGYMFRLWRSWALAAAPFLALSTAQASPDMPELQRLDAPGMQWSDTTRMMLSGIALHVRPFRSSRPPVQIAESLSARSDLFQRVLWRSRGMVMSGLADGWHWVARVDAAGAGSEGDVSAMRLPMPGTDNAPTGRTPTPPHWLPAGASLRFRADGMPPDGSVQEIYHVPLANESLGTSVGQALQREGWRPDAGRAGASSWHKAGARLQWFSVAADQGSHLFVHFDR